MARDVTLLPQPDSPTMPTVLPRSTENLDAVHCASAAAVLARERHLQVANLEQRVAHGGAVLFGGHRLGDPALDLGAVRDAERIGPATA